MEPLSSYIKNSQKIQENNDRIYHEIVNHPKMKAFMAAHEGEITRSMIQNDLMVLKHYVNQKDECEPAGDGKCLSHPDGFIIKLEIRQGRFNMVYKKCPIREKYEDFLKRESLIQSFHIPRDVREATFDSIYINEARRQVLENAITKASKIARGEDYRGLYLYGEFGIGKSYILGCIANELKEKSISSMMIYVPEILRDLKAGFNDGTTNERYDAIRNAEVLILDDLGAEDVTAWSRDEVITSILNYRMVEQLPTFISSNFAIDDLVGRYAYTKTNGKEETKALRMVERIRALCEEVELKGDNLRRS